MILAVQTEELRRHAPSMNNCSYQIMNAHCKTLTYKLNIVLFNHSKIMSKKGIMAINRILKRCVMTSTVRLGLHNLKVNTHRVTLLTKGTLYGWSRIPSGPRKKNVYDLDKGFQRTVTVALY